MAKRSLAGSVSTVMVIMVLSRLLALVSTQVYISVFGTVGDINIYSYAISIPNTIFNCFGTALSTVVIPLYAGHLANGEDDEAARFANNIITISTVFTAVLVLLGMAAAFVLPLTTQFNAGDDYRFAVKALMIMMPVMLFTGLNYIFQGILQSRGRYGWPAFVSVPSSLIVIAYVFLLSDRYGVTGLLIATFLGLSTQALILIPPLIAAGFRYKPSFDLRDPDIRKAAKMTVPVLIGVSAYQLNMFYNTTMIAGFENMTTLLTYVQNLVLYMVLAFVYSVTAVLYPKLTESYAAGREEEYKQTLSSTLSSVFALLVPVTFGLMAVREPLLDLIAGWGRFTAEDVRKAALIMLLYAIGILGIGAKEILDRAFYACGDTMTPAICGFIIMFVNISLSLILMRFMGPYGIPLAYSAASLVGLAALLFLLRRKVGVFAPGLGTDTGKCFLAGIVMFLAVWGTGLLTNRVFAGDALLHKIVRLGLPVLIGVTVYALAALLLGIGAAKAVAGAVGRRLGRGKKEGIEE